MRSGIGMRSRSGRITEGHSNRESLVHLIGRQREAAEPEAHEQHLEMNRRDESPRYTLPR